MLKGQQNDWHFAQVFGEKGNIEEINEADIISTVEFDHTGQYLATGDRGGRIVLFERENGPCSGDYKFFVEFQSHEPEFDYLKSLEIEEKINKIKWLKRRHESHFLISTNDKTIKLWKVHPRSQYNFSDLNTVDAEGRKVDPSSITSLKVPKVASTEVVTHHNQKRVFSNAHAFHINSVSLNCDDETWLSADELRINLWNIDVSAQSFNIIDIKPSNMEEPVEEITAAEFHPNNCNVFMYSSSKGIIKMCDMRSQATCHSNFKVFDEEEDPRSKSFFSEIISSISDVKFSHDGRYIISRDYLTIKVWDVNMDTRPVRTISVHDHLRSKLCDLYENDCIFDRFECEISGDSKSIMTGSYNNGFHIFDREGDGDNFLEAHKNLRRPSKATLKKNKNSDKKREVINPDKIDFNRKIMHATYNPSDDCVALAATQNLYIFSRE